MCHCVLTVCVDYTSPTTTTYVVCLSANLVLPSVFLRGSEMGGDDMC